MCGSWTADEVCPACETRYGGLRLRCPRCGLAQQHAATLCGGCVVEPAVFRRTVVGLDYVFPWNRLITRLKFGNAPELAPMLARRLLRAVQADTPTDPAVQAVLAVPLSQARLQQRGYNQAWELARPVARALGLPLRADVLTRWRDTPQQAKLNRQERANNLRAAFWIEPAARGWLQGQHLALVDDVMTTGATATEVTRTLLAGGAASVDLWVLARTPPDA